MIDWPRLLCPHCGNREHFEVEIRNYARLDFAKRRLKPAVQQRGAEMAELPFNSKCRCLQCNKRGRWNAWQRGAYSEC